MIINNSAFEILDFKKVKIKSRNNTEYYREIVTVKCPKCKNIFERAYRNLLHAKKCKKCSHLENNKKKFKNGHKTVGDLSGSMVATIKQGAKRRNLEYNITSEFLWDLFLKQDKKCALSGLPLKLSTYNMITSTGKSKHYNKSIVTASLDRKNSNIGYIESNVQWVHKIVNILKGAITDNDFIYFCKKIAKFNEEKDNSEPSFIHGYCGDAIMKKVQRLTIEENSSNNIDTRIPHPNKLDDDIV
jgi:hypothetical protein